MPPSPPTPQHPADAAPPRDDASSPTAKLAAVSLASEPPQTSANTPPESSPQAPLDSDKNADQINTFNAFRRRSSARLRGLDPNLILV